MSARVCRVCGPYYSTLHDCPAERRPVTADDQRLVTATEAAQLTGVPPGTIRSAAARDVPGQPGIKQLAQWGLEADGQTKLYRLCDIRQLATTTRRRRRATADTPRSPR